MDRNNMWQILCDFLHHKNTYEFDENVVDTFVLAKKKN